MKTVVRQIRDKRQQYEIAKACGISRQAVEQWKSVPPTRVLMVEKITGIPRHRIRPDIYPKT